MAVKTSLAITAVIAIIILSIIATYYLLQPKQSGLPQLTPKEVRLGVADCIEPYLDYGMIAVQAQDPGLCELARDPYKKTICHAQYTGRAEYCEEILDPDYQSLCTAKATSDANTCERINTTTTRTLCTALVRQSVAECRQLEPPADELCTMSVTNDISKIRKNPDTYCD